MTPEERAKAVVDNENWMTTDYIGSEEVPVTRILPDTLQAMIAAAIRDAEEAQRQACIATAQEMAAYFTARGEYREADGAVAAAVRIGFEGLQT